MAYLEQTQKRSSAVQLDNRQEQPNRHWLTAEQRFSLLILVGVIGGWEIAAAMDWVNLLFFPAPSTIVYTLGEGLLEGTLQAHLSATLVRLGGGLLLGGGTGLAVGVLMGWSQRLCKIIEPFVAAFYPMPKIALLPLAMIFFGMGESSKILLIAVSSFFPMLINTLAGIQQLAPIHWEVAANYGASSWQLWRRVLLPGSLPLLLTGLRIALNTALIVTLSVELLSAQTGLGSTIWFAWQTMRLRELYATLVVIGLLGYGSNRFVANLSVHLTPWQHRVS